MGIAPVHHHDGARGGSIYAVVAEASIAPGRVDVVVRMTESQVVPLLKSHAGHGASYFTRSSDGTNGLSICNE
jgi:hypothetical protein